MTASRWRIGRMLVVLLLALAAAFQVVRSAAVTRFAVTRPDLAAQFWPGNPDVELALAMAAIGTSAANGRGATPVTLALVNHAAQRAPLAVEPFLVEGAVALSRGDVDRAERLFEVAKHRDPRSPAARYFLAQRYLTSGRAAAGLGESAVLVRLVGGGSSIVPGIAEYARTPGAIPQLRQLFASNPGLGDEVLGFLAREATNAPLVVALAGDALGRDRREGPPAWQSSLLGALIDKGDFEGAHGLWAKIGGLKKAPPILFNPQFEKLRAPAPFNWTLSSGEFGVAEPLTSGGLQILYYGRINAEFASQTLLLPAGNYALRMQVTREADSSASSGLSWSVTCQPHGRALLNLPLAGEAGVAKPLGGRFTVPIGCPAQVLKLKGTPGELATSEQAAIRDLQLTRLAR